MIMSARPSTTQVHYQHPSYHHQHHHHHLPYVPDAVAPAPSRTASSHASSHVFAIDFIMNPCESDNEAEDEEPVTPLTSQPPSPASTVSSPSIPPPPPPPQSSSAPLLARKKTHSIYKISSSPPPSSLHERRESTSSTSSKVSKRNYQRHDKTKIAKLLEIYYVQKQSVRVAAKMVDIPRATAGRYIQKEKASREANAKKYVNHTNK
ncbi:hypothetical protein BX666DRAFT_2121089 [Dichotomocladium elegans]|nr:hypothetical protein BX666DRAFT_2121089 [Dichotomocladium elegans]